MVRGQRHADEAAHRMADDIERIGSVEVGDLHKIPNMTVPSVGTSRSYLAPAPPAQIHGDDVAAGSGEHGHQMVEGSAVGGQTAHTEHQATERSAVRLQMQDAGR